VTTLRLGTRGSELALFQARAVAALMASRGAGRCDITVIHTSGDRLAEQPLSDVGGKRVFVREIEDALLAGTIDLAVHSSKDLPAELPDGLQIGAVLPREDPTDAVVRRGGGSVEFEALTRWLAPGTRIGTGSVRRIAQLRPILSQASFEPIRGNLDTRLRKLDRGDYDVIVLASAGLRRLGLRDRISVAIPVEICVPAPGQGIIAVEIRSDDDRMRKTLAAVDDAPAAAALSAERALVETLGGGCQMPIGALCRPSNGALDLLAVVASLDGAHVVRHRRRGLRQAPVELGRQVADELLRQGAAEILAQAQAGGASVPESH
jgi:hydroxymethylbilane synthase